ncbi:YadA-like family protein [Veillonella sp.]|uniref:YadA-like family protein n=1 Tax=Veillonella sp. TaxID=1926307 RepID=UPI0029066F0B|nr:YadA-like family protein [Veillonella sp.]MDU6548493.1 YadA-like family protein [Veillonella sp.]
MNKKLLLMAGVLSIIGSSAMADNITQGPGDITIWRTSDGNVVGNTVIDSNSISVNDNSMTATTGNKNRTLITTDSVVVHSGTFNRDRIEGGLYNNGGVAFSKFQYNPGEDVPSKRSFATLTLEYGLELQKAEPGSNPGMDNRRTSLLNTEELRIRKIEDNSVYSQIEVASNGLKIMDGNPKQPTSRKNLEFSSEKVDVGGQTINNVAEGVDGTDAVNVNQLESYVASKIKPVKSGDNITVNPNYDFFRNVDSFSVDLNKDLTDMNSVKFKNEEFDTESEINHASASFYNKKQNEGSALTSHSLEMNTKNGSSSLDGTSLTISNGIDGNIATMGANGFATETKDGKHLEFSSDNVTVAGQQIHDVAKGIDDTDAVNVKQLKDYVAANGTVDTNTITTVTNGDNATVTSTTDASGNKEFKVAVNKDLTDMNSARFVSGDNETKVDGAEITFKSNKDQVHTEVQAGAISVSTEKNRTVIYEDGVIIGNAAETELSTSDSSGLSVTNADGKKVEFKLNNVSVGDNQIHDVATGIADTDAVNVKQLKEYMSTNDKDTITTVKAGNNIEVTANGHDYTVSLNKDVVDKIDNATAGVKANADTIKSNTDAIKANTADIADNKAQIDNLVNQIGNNDTKINNMISNTRHEARRGIASASALAALHPLDYNPDHKVDVMGGVGHYRGKTAVALGAAYRPNENLMFTVGTAINGKDSSVNAGVSYKVGAKDSTYKSQASLAKDVEDLKQIVAKLQA